MPLHAPPDACCAGADRASTCCSTEWLVPPQHKQDFASVFLKTKEQVLRTNGGVKRVDLLEVRPPISSVC